MIVGVPVVPISLVQYPNYPAAGYALATDSEATSISGQFFNGTAAGNTIVIAAGVPQVATGVTVTSGPAATFTRLIGSSYTSGYPVMEIWTCANAPAGIQIIQMNFASSTVFSDFALFELTNMPTTIKTDGTAATKTGTSTAAPSSPAITTAGINDIIIALVMTANPSVSAAGASWPNHAAGLQNNSLMVQWQLASGPKNAISANATFSPATAYSGAIFALKGLGA